MLASMMSGVFITIEGGGRSARTAQIHRLAVRLRSHGVDVVEMPEIGAEDGSAAILNLIQPSPPGQWSPEAEALLIFAAHNDVLEKLVRPALAGGRWIVGTGFAEAARVRQSAHSGVEAAWLQSVEDMVIGPHRPNLTFILEGGSPSVADKGDSQDLLKETGSLSQRTRRALLDIARNDPERCRLVDPRDGADAVAETIWKAVSVVLAARGHSLAAG